MFTELGLGKYMHMKSYPIKVIHEILKEITGPFKYLKNEISTHKKLNETLFLKYKEQCTINKKLELDIKEN